MPASIADVNSDKSYAIHLLTVMIKKRKNTPGNGGIGIYETVTWLLAITWPEGVSRIDT